MVQAGWALPWPWASSSQGWAALLMQADPVYNFPISSDFPNLSKCSMFESVKHSLPTVQNSPNLARL
jgi:hypothetical protein